MKLDFKWDQKVILEFELNDFTLYVTLLGIEHNVLITKKHENKIVMLGYLVHMWGIDIH